MPAPLLAPRCRTFSVPKRGHDARECQDAFAACLERGRVAIADGAAESAHAGPWARLLVEEFISADEEALAGPGWIARAQARFAEAVRRPADAEPLPWYLEGRYAQGAYATFLGLALDCPTWQAVAVGDSCLFQERGDALIVVYPLEHSAQFDNTPSLIGSRTCPNEVPRRWGVPLLGECRPGDRLWLMTDALARWFLCEREAGRRPWRDLAALLCGGEEAFAAFVEGLRDRRALRNDDTTLAAVSL
jgi:hypothetical protein